MHKNVCKPWYLRPSGKAYRKCPYFPNVIVTDATALLTQVGAVACRILHVHRQMVHD